MLDHAGVKEQTGVSGTERQRMSHRSAGSYVMATLVKRPAEQVVAIDIFSGSDLLLDLGQYPRQVAIVVEQEQAPCPMKWSRLSYHCHFHAVVVLAGLCRIADFFFHVPSTTE